MAIDCEMVGVGAQGVQSTLGRVSIVNWHGAVLLDTFVKPKERVVDYRTWVSGVSAEDLANGAFSHRAPSASRYCARCVPVSV
jgi:RNA exonuclease 4